MNRLKGGLNRFKHLNKKYIHIIIAILFAGSFKAVSQSTIHKPVLVAGNTFPDRIFVDQFGNKYQVNSYISKLIFTFEPKSARLVNKYLSTKPVDFLTNQHALYIGDISKAPSFIRRFFILPGLRKYEFPVLIITNEDEAKIFRQAIDIQKIILVKLKDQKIILVQELEPDIKSLNEVFSE